MYITKGKFEEICKKYSSLLVVEGDVAEALNFVQELLEAEADALKNVEPEATASIDRLNAAAYEVFDIQGDIENEEFQEQEGDLPKNVYIPVGDLRLDADMFSYGEDGSVSYDKEALADVVGEYLSDTYGYCHLGFHMELAYSDGKVADIHAMNIQWDVDKEEELTVVRSLDELKAYVEENGWHIEECNIGPANDFGWELSKCSPAGEDFFFAIEHNNDVEPAVQALKQYAYNFDIDEHVQLNLGGRGAPGVVELVEDAKEIQAMLDELADGVNWCEQKTISETLAEAEVRSGGAIGNGKEQEPELE